MGNLSREELERLLVSAERTQALAEDELDRRQRIDRWADAPPPTAPIWLPREFSWLAEDPSNAHELLQRQSVDPTWSLVAEAQLYNYFAERPEITTRFGIPTIACRVTGCEIAFVSSSVDSETFQTEQAPNAQFATMMEFAGANSELFEQPWADQFERGTNGVPSAMHTEGGVTTVLWHVWRGDNGTASRPEDLRIGR
jgi:hypothetical protein